MIRPAVSIRERPDRSWLSPVRNSLPGALVGTVRSADFPDAALAHGLKGAAVDLRNSGDTAGRKNEVVGYGAFHFGWPEWILRWFTLIPGGLTAVWRRSPDVRMQSVRCPACSFLHRTFMPGIRAFAVVTVVASAAAAFAAAVLAADWVPLFNGKDLTGWTAVHDVKFEAHDGALRLVRRHGLASHGEAVRRLPARSGITSAGGTLR